MGMIFLYNKVNFYVLWIFVHCFGEGSQWFKFAHNTQYCDYETTTAVRVGAVHEEYVLQLFESAYPDMNKIANTIIPLFTDDNADISTSVK